MRKVNEAGEDRVFLLRVQARHGDTRLAGYVSHALYYVLSAQPKCEFKRQK